MTRKLNEKNYIVIADWMLELGLNTRELLTYALIYSFGQYDSYYYGSLEYLAAWLGINDRTNATRYLKPLVDKGLITKTDFRSKLNQKGCLYRTTSSYKDVVSNPDVDYLIIQPWMLQNLHLNGKDLLLYAVVHGYSRKESGNICEYKKDYFAKWLQCRKDHVGRQIKQAINNGLIREENGGFVAIVPDDIRLTQTDNTPLKEEEIDFTQIDNTYPQTDNTPSPKLTTNNLVIDNLEDNLVLNNDSSNKFSTVEYPSKEELSVVVNEEIPVLDFSLEMEKKAFAYKQEKDYELYRKYRKKNPFISEFMKQYALSHFRMMLARWPDTLLADKTETLLLDALCSSAFKDRQRDILDLGKDKISELYHIALDLCDPENDLKVTKSRKAYLIGVIRIMLEEA